VYSGKTKDTEEVIEEMKSRGNSLHMNRAISGSLFGHLLPHQHQAQFHQHKEISS
jgi:hypothetical protein